MQRGWVALSVAGVSVLILTLGWRRESQAEEAVLFFFCGCNPCVSIAKELRGSKVAQGYIIRGVTELGPADQAKFLATSGLSIPVSSDASGVLRGRLSVTRCPAVRIIRRDAITVSWDPIVWPPDENDYAKLRWMLSAADAR